jgi:hypothetical protein
MSKTVEFGQKAQRILGVKSMPTRFFPFLSTFGRNRAEFGDAGTFEQSPPTSTACKT